MPAFTVILQSHDTPLPEADIRALAELVFGREAASRFTVERVFPGSTDKTGQIAMASLPDGHISRAEIEQFQKEASKLAGITSVSLPAVRYFEGNAKSAGGPAR